MDNAGGSAGSVHAFWCNICKVACASAVNLQTHFLGSKHKMLEKALKAHGIVKTMTSEPTGPGKVPDCAITEMDSSPARTLEEQLDGCRSTEPAVGLEYLYEYRSQGSYMYYECVLCGCEAGLTNMFMHVVGAKHRLAYLNKHHPDLAEVTGRGSELHKKLKQIAAQVEATDGRKKITVVTDEQLLKRKYGIDDDDVGPHKTKRIDFTSDDFCIEPTGPPAAPASNPGPSPSFQELKRAHAEAAKKQQQVPEKNDDGFGSKKELLEYLRQFQITCEDDATFVLKVTQSFTQSLVKYREMAKAKADAAAAAPPEITSQPQMEAPPAAGHNIYTEYPPKNPPGQKILVPAYNAEANRSAAGTNPTPTVPVSNKMLPASSTSQNPKNVGPAATNTRVPQGFPGGSLGPLQETNKATIEFFTSIKNMDAEEVSATLRKIAATNPAFKGIDIPNVIKILSESGSLKPSTTGKTQH